MKPHLSEYWCIPPKQNAAFVAQMEEVLDLYHEPYNEELPLVCMDETSKQLVKETRTPLPCEPGKVRRLDYEYERNGVANLFMFCEPLTGLSWVNVTERRTRMDWASQVRWLLEEIFPGRGIKLVCDNLNTHNKSSLYEAFDAATANRLEIHYTPKHGSWLNIAEIELRVLTGQCLSRRIATRRGLKRQVTAWQHRRNKEVRAADWRFTTKDARIKLKHLYPKLQS